MTWKADYAALPARLTAARRRSGLTQLELAERLGMSLSTIQRVEAGRTDPKLLLLVHWAAAVGLRLHLTPLADDPPKTTRQI